MSEKKPFENFLEFSGLGIEMAVSVLIGLGLGLLFDNYFSTSPWGILVGTLLGVAAAMKKIIDLAISEEKRDK